ncbi:hypothetical protein ACR3K2_13370 [Cryptosporidium serpentis]
MSSCTRKQCDFTKLIMAGYEVELNNSSTQDFFVIFCGPKETAYEDGIWKVHVTLPDDYPFASPSIGFMSKILHPNIDEHSGSVCLDVINQTWTPIYSLVNIFDIFLPQLLTYPNPVDPLNSSAAALFLEDKSLYEQKVREYVKTHSLCKKVLKTKMNPTHNKEKSEIFGNTYIKSTSSIEWDSAISPASPLSELTSLESSSDSEHSFIL